MRVIFGVARTLPERYNASTTAKTDRVAKMACRATPGQRISNSCDRPPRKTPWAAAYTAISAGDGSRLIALIKPVTRPISAAPKYRTGLKIVQPTIAPMAISPKTTPERLMTEAYVIRPVSVGVADGCWYILASW